MRCIPLTKGMTAKVDDEDFDRINQFKWRVLVTRRGTGNPYAIRSAWSSGKQQTVYMHRFILGTSQSLDHKDGDSLNNQKCNLRPANCVQNGRNRKVQEHSSPYKGVSLAPARRKWHARAKMNGKDVHLGFYNSPEAAAIAYDSFAISNYGEFARTNHRSGLI